MVKPLQNLEEDQKSGECFRISINLREDFKSEIIISLHKVTSFMAHLMNFNVLYFL